MPTGWGPARPPRPKRGRARSFRPAPCARFVDKTTSLIYTPFRYPVCGDGEIAPGYESCEPNVFPNGCSGETICHPTGCTCVFPGCGNGILEPGEDCEPYAYPNGCAFDEYCRFGDCRCEGPGSASRAFLDPAPDLLD